MILLRREKPLQPVPTGKEIGGFRGNQFPGHKGSSVCWEGSRGVSCSSLCSGGLLDGGGGCGGAQGVRALVLLKELMVPGPLGWAQPPGSRAVTVKMEVGLTGSRRQRGLKVEEFTIYTYKDYKKTMRQATGGGPVRRLTPAQSVMMSSSTPQSS